ncbi:hypothetical protein [Streptomyces sp. KL116D]|uniref:hypothetical protein n=1 Tax=Streptomyces sp. KL116D TaxID=3045152 RepID=UPI0035565FB4
MYGGEGLDPGERVVAVAVEGGAQRLVAAYDLGEAAGEHLAVEGAAQFGDPEMV